MLGNHDLAELTARNGEYFYLTDAERIARSGGLLRGRQFGGIIYSAEMQAWAARAAGDREMGRAIWRRLLGLLYAANRPEGFAPVVYGHRDDGAPTMEIPWLTTNFTAQWCLKVIVTAELIPDDAPETLEELAEALKRQPSQDKMYGA